MHALDLAIIAAFLVGMPLVGIWIAGRQRSGADYFVGDGKISWWVACLSVVSAETSTLTVLSVPTVAYLGAFTYLQLAIGYVIGRTIVAFVLLPRFVAGNLTTAYNFLGTRFGAGLQGTASVTFLVTRLLADGVRLFATAIPIKVVLKEYGLHAAYWQIVAVLGVAMVVYTFFGGVRAVVWVDAIQLLWYVAGGIVVVAVLANRLPSGWLRSAVDAGKTQMFDFASAPVGNQYASVTAVFGGAVLSMASHGADHLIVQRLMACNDVRASQRALIASGVVVFLQFALFLLIGTMLWAFYKGLNPVRELGLTSNDELFASFIVHELPSGLSGFVIAGILAAALSSSLGALASSTVSDVYQRIVRRPLTAAESLRQGRIWTVVWAGALIVFASMFTTTKNPIVETALAITGYTYGALLGAFLLGVLVRRARQADAVAAFVTTVAVMAFVILGVKFSKQTGAFLGVDFAKPSGDSVALAFPWYTPLGVLVTLLVGGLLSLRSKRPNRADSSPTQDPDRTPAP